jgi:hypothetical protein
MKVNKINVFFRGWKSPLVRNIVFPRFFRGWKSPVNKIKSYYKYIPENRKKRKKRYVATQRKIALL